MGGEKSTEDLQAPPTSSSAPSQAPSTPQALHLPQAVRHARPADDLERDLARRKKLWKPNPSSFQCGERLWFGEPEPKEETSDSGSLGHRWAPFGDSGPIALPSSRPPPAKPCQRKSSSREGLWQQPQWRLREGCGRSPPGTPQGKPQGGKGGDRLLLGGPGHRRGPVARPTSPPGAAGARRPRVPEGGAAAAGACRPRRWRPGRSSRTPRTSGCSRC